MSNTPPSTSRRHALGMPAGSVRALLAFCVLAYLWIMALAPTLFGRQAGAPEAFVYMQVVMVLAIAHYLGAHGRSIGGPASPRSPLWMPRGSIRILLLVGYFGMIYFTYHKHLTSLLTGSEAYKPIYIPDIGPLVLVIALVMAAWLAGHISTNIMSWLAGGTLPSWFQDVQAWVALVSLLLLGVVIIVRLVINPTVSEESQLTLKYTEPAMAAFVAFYFGARS